MRSALPVVIVVLAACGGGSSDPECTTATDCPASTSECASYGCPAGSCVLTPVAAGTATVAQIAGDCQRSECDGAGATRMVNDDADTPDANECSIGACSDGVASLAPAPAGTECGTGLHCDGDGNCVTCIDASECPGADTECATRTCVDGACGVDNTLGGTAISTQVAGDCHVAVCDGAGGETTAIDDGDRPDDGNPCTDDLCTAGDPSNPPLPTGTSCGASSTCDGAGTCTTCGNSVIEGTEQCDDTDLGGQTCQSVGFATGTLACTPTCTLDLSGCSTCGDGAITGTELCDGTNVGTETCTGLGLPPGTLLCNATCDGYDTTGCAP